MKVMKFGGTSVGSPERISQVANLVTDGDANIVVLSAMSGDTNALLSIADCFQEGNLPGAFAAITELYKKYVETIRQLFPNGMEATMVLSEIDNHLAELPDLNRNEIVAKGEIISTTIMNYLLQSRGNESIMLPALLFMRTLPDGSPDYDFISERLSALLSRTNAKIIITQGFICRDAEGEVSNLQRGGSDFTATIIGSVIQAEEIQIWTDIDGLHNNDPRIVENTRPIRHLSHRQASVLAFFGAKILHPLCIAPAEKASVPVKLLNTFQPSAPGTLIDSEPASGKIIAVAARDGSANQENDKVVLRFADSMDCYSFNCTETVDKSLAAVCVVGDVTAEEITKLLSDISIPVYDVTEESGYIIAVIPSDNKVAALRAIL